MQGTPLPVLRSARRPVVRLLSSLHAIRAGYLARSCLAWPKLQPNQDSPARAAIPALAARVARQCSSHICLRRPLAGGGRLVVARDIDVLCGWRFGGLRTEPGDAVAAAQGGLRAALDELGAAEKRLLFVEHDWPRARRARARFYARACAGAPSYARPAPGIIVWRRAATRGCRYPTRSTSRKTPRAPRPRRRVAQLCGGDDFGRRTPPRRGARGRSAPGSTCSAASTRGRRARPPPECRRSATFHEIHAAVGAELRVGKQMPRRHSS